MKERGILYGVGVGPGDPELMTYKAIKTIEDCEIIAVPNVNREKSVSYRIAAGIIHDIDKNMHRSGYTYDKGQGSVKPGI